MITITNRVLEKASGFSHSQIKRWAVAFLPPNKKSGQHSGIPRSYNYEESWKIYLGGYLVRDLKFTLMEAQETLNDLTGWFKEKRWTVSAWVNFRKSSMSRGVVAKCEFPWHDLLVDIGIGNQGRFFYVAKIVIEQKLIREPDRWQDKYDIEHFGKLSPVSIGHLRSIAVKSMVVSLANNIARNVSE